MHRYFRWVILSLVILLVAVGLRFTNLNSLPIFADESIYIHWAQIMRAEPTLHFLPLSDGKQPLFMWSIIPLLKIFSDPLVAGRLMSGLCGIFTIAGVFFAAQTLFHKKSLSFLSAFILAVLPYSLFFDRLALADSMLTMFIVWTFVFSGLAMTKSRFDLSMLAGFTLGFAYLTKSPALFSFLLIPLFLLLVDFKSKTPIQLIKLILQIGTTYIIAFAMYNILRLGPEFHMIALRNKDYVYPFSEIMHHPWRPLLPHLSDVVNIFVYFLTPVGLLLVIWGLVSQRLSNWRQSLIIAAWFIIPVLGESAIAISLTARYLLFTIPFVAIIMARGLINLYSSIKIRSLFWIFLFSFFSLCFVMDYLLLFRIQEAPLPRVERNGYLEEWTAGTGLKEVSWELQKYSMAGPVLVGSEGYFGTPFDGLGVYLNHYPNIRIIGVGVDIDSVSDKLTNALKDNQVFLVVNSNRFHGNPDKLGLKLLGSYPKAAWPDGHRDSLLFFKVLSRP